jgi:hypothetical protein
MEHSKHTAVTYLMPFSYTLCLITLQKKTLLNLLKGNTETLRLRHILLARTQNTHEQSPTTASQQLRRMAARSCHSPLHLVCRGLHYQSTGRLTVGYLVLSTKVRAVRYPNPHSCISSNHALFKLRCLRPLQTASRLTVF